MMRKYSGGAGDPPVKKAKLCPTNSLAEQENHNTLKQGSHCRETTLDAFH